MEGGDYMETNNMSEKLTVIFDEDMNEEASTQLQLEQSLAMAGSGGGGGGGGGGN